MELVFVGTSDAFGAGGRRQSALLLRSDAGALLLDCAPTTGTGLAALGLARESIDAIAISHFHADHFAGVPQFLLAANFEDQRRRPLAVAGPPGIETRVRAVAAAAGTDLERPLSYPLHFIEWGGDEPVALGGAQVRTFRTYHQEVTEPHGFVIECGGKHLAYSGDTGWFDALPDAVGAVDLFVCECTFYEREFEYHLSYQQFAKHAHTFRCGRIVLTHFSEEMSGRRGQLAFETADDGLCITL